MLFVARKNRLLPKTKNSSILSIEILSFKMNKIINKFLLTRDKCMPELLVKQQGFTCIACELFTKYPKRTQKFRETGNLKYLHRN